MQLQPCTMSGEQSATAQITTMNSRLAAVDLLPPASGTSTIKVYDTASGDTSQPIIFEYTIAAGTSASSLSMPLARIANKGLYVVLSGSSTTYNIGYTIA